MLDNRHRGYNPDDEDIKLAAIMGRRGGNCRKVSLKYAADALCMSQPAIAKRLNKMVRGKFINGFTADINLRMLYPNLTSGIIAVYLKHKADRREIKQFIEKCVYIQRSYDGKENSDYIFEVITPNRQGFNDVYHRIGALYSVEKVDILATFSGGVEHHNQAELLPAV